MGIKRTGECGRCGRCCEVAYINIPPVRGELLEDMKRYLDLHEVTYLVSEHGLDIRIGGRCKELYEKGGIFSCRVHDTKPAMCKVSPVVKEYRVDCVGYRWGE